MRGIYLRFPCGNLFLEGALSWPQGAGPFAVVVVCHPHPLYGGTMDNNVVLAVCQALYGESMVAFRFNFRGVGGSQGALVEGKKGFALLEVRPHTGRTHQIRVHLSALGHPVAGDAKYGGRVPFLRRQFLHAHRLAFRLPLAETYAEFTSPLPPDLEEALGTLVPGSGS